MKVKCKNMPIEINNLSHSQYFRFYRDQLGFLSQNAAKDYFGAKNITPCIDEKYLNALLGRVEGIVKGYNKIIIESLRPADIDLFIRDKILYPLNEIKKHELLHNLNNHGRRPEQVLFSWLRGYSTAEYFIPALKHIFNITDLNRIGGDDFTNPDTFRRTPTADYETSINGNTIRFEIQSGFQSINDVKQHKVIEAKNVFRDHQIKTICVHFDLFNGQCAFIRLDTIQDEDPNWITRAQMEGQYVFSIEQNYFNWRLMNNPPNGTDLVDLNL